MIDAFAEEAAFTAARHVLVPGAVIQEGVAIAEEELSVLGIKNPSVVVTPTNNTAPQSEIDFRTDWVEVTVSVPMADNTFFGSFFNDAVITRTAKLRTERAPR